MKTKDAVYCNVCLESDKDRPNVVFVQAICNGENIDVCTACMPTIIHGSGEAVKSNDEVKKELNL